MQMKIQITIDKFPLSALPTHKILWFIIIKNHPGAIDNRTDCLSDWLAWLVV